MYPPFLEIFKFYVFAQIWSLKLKFSMILSSPRQILCLKFEILKLLACTSLTSHFLAENVFWGNLEARKYVVKPDNFKLTSDHGPINLKNSKFYVFLSEFFFETWKIQFSSYFWTQFWTEKCKLEIFHGLIPILNFFPDAQCTPKTWKFQYFFKIW